MLPDPHWRSFLRRLRPILNADPDPRKKITPIRFFFAQTG